MAHPIQNYPNMYPSQTTGADGMLDHNGGGFVPNGQPPQFTRPPVYPEKTARPASAHPPPAGYQIPTNGTQYSHPSSLSSHSSRDPSPVPHTRPDPALSSYRAQLLAASSRSTPTSTPPPAPSPAATPDLTSRSTPTSGPYAGPNRPTLATNTYPVQPQPQAASNSPQFVPVRPQMSPVTLDTSSTNNTNVQSTSIQQPATLSPLPGPFGPPEQAFGQVQGQARADGTFQGQGDRTSNIPATEQSARTDTSSYSASQTNSSQFVPLVSSTPALGPGSYPGATTNQHATWNSQQGLSTNQQAALTTNQQAALTTNQQAMWSSTQSLTTNQQATVSTNQQALWSSTQSLTTNQATVSTTTQQAPSIGRQGFTTNQQAPTQLIQFPAAARTNAQGTLPRPDAAQLPYAETSPAAATVGEPGAGHANTLAQLQFQLIGSQNRMSSYSQQSSPQRMMFNGNTSGVPPQQRGIAPQSGVPPPQQSGVPPQQRGIAPQSVVPPQQRATAPVGLAPQSGSVPPQARIASGPGIRPPHSSGGPTAGMAPPTGMRPQMGIAQPAGMRPQTGMGPPVGMSFSGVGPPSGIRPPTGMGPPQPGMAPQPGMSYSGMGPPSGIRPPGMGPPQPGMGPPQPGMGPPTGMAPPPLGMAPPPLGMAPPMTGTMPPATGSYPQPGMAANQYVAPQTSQPDSSSHLPKRYPQQPKQSSYNSSSMHPSPAVDANFNQQLAGLSVSQTGFSKLWGADSYDLLQTRNILPPDKVEMPKVKLQQEFLDAVNCSPEIFRCTMTKIPETNSLLQKSRLPLGILIHPFKDLNHLAVIQCQSIVRCRACRTYINPFVYFVDHKRWKCNLCFRVNELPEEFQFDPVSKTYGDPSRRPEIKSATIEFIAPSEYMLRPPQPAVYLFLLDVSCLATECGYLDAVCAVLLDELDRLPGDGRTQVGFVTYDSAVHFYSLAEGLGQPQQMIVTDVNEIFLPCPFSLVVNLNESKELIRDLLRELPKKFKESHDNNSALGAALQAAYKLMSPTGGRITVFQACLPNHGPGALASREDPSARANKEVHHLNPATDFYKRLALDCSGQQVAVDLFVVNQQYCDLATLSGISRFSGGSMHHFPLFKARDALKAEAFEQSFRRYLTRKLGLEAVMRIRCSRGLAIHTFHGNFFVRSTDLLSLPNVNPDAGFAMQVSVDESLSDLQNVCFQAALLYTSSKGERRIRVHTLCLPVAANLSDILQSADQQAIVGLLAKMAVDRSMQSSLSDAREAFVNVAVDVLSAYKVAQSSSGSSALLAPFNLRLLPMYILALLKYVAFRTGQSTRLDDRVYAMCQMKTMPLSTLIQEIYPDMYPVHALSAYPTIDVEGTIVPQPPRLQLTAERLEASGAFLLDACDRMILFIGRSVNTTFCQAVFGVHAFQEISENLHDLPEIDTPESESLRNFVNYLQMEKSCPATLQIIRDDSQNRQQFYDRLLEDRTESTFSYYEFLQHLKTNVK